MNRTIRVIIGSVRPDRVGDRVAGWVMEEAKGRSHNGPIYTIADLREINLPFMDEPVPPRTAKEYVHEHTRQWSRLIDGTDGFVFVVPEYNHGYAPAVKNALDYLSREWQGKPAALVGYGGSGARDSIRQLREVMTTIGLVPLEQQVGVSRVWEAFGDDGRLDEGHITGNLPDLLEALEKSLG